MTLFSKTINRMQRNKEKGFTLIELMIVVAILGILAAIAIPNFMRFQAKSKQSEAKTNLGAIGTTVESFRSENDTYDATWAELGWAPQGTPRYEYVYNGVDGGFLAACSDMTAVAVIAAGPPPTFVIGATGNIDTDATCDEWTYNQARVLDNSLSNDVSG